MLLNATYDEIKFAIEELYVSTIQVNKLKDFARFLGRRTNEDIVEDLIQDAMLLLLDGTRAWNPSITPEFPNCLRSIIKSLIFNHYQRNKLRGQQSLEDSLGTADSVPISETVDGGYEQEELRQILLALVSDNEMARKVMNAHLQGLSKSEMISKLGITETNYESAMKYIRRKGRQSHQLRGYFSASKK